MDSISQFVLGASIGEVLFGKKLGNKALIWGGLLATIPDLDVLPGKMMDVLSRVEFHRGPSHSITFALLLAYPLGWIIQRCHRHIALSLHRLALFVFLALFTHALLDLCTTWGTQLFWPFFDKAYALQIVFVVDPLYTLPFLLALPITLFLSRENQWRLKLNQLALILSTGYLCWCVWAKLSVHQQFESIFQQCPEPVLQWTSRPAPLSSMLWTATAETEHSYFISYVSLWDRGEPHSPTQFEKNLKTDAQWKDQRDYQRLKAISQGMLLTKPYPDGIEVADLRFGQSLGWADSSSEFVFRYRLKGDPKSSVFVESVPPNYQNKSLGFDLLWRRMWGERF